MYVTCYMYVYMYVVCMCVCHILYTYIIHVCMQLYVCTVYSVVIHETTHLIFEVLKFFFVFFLFLVKITSTGTVIYITQM